jgi:flavorubredoxin
LSYVDYRLGGELLAKVFVAYDKKYGNTKLVAESILKGISEAGGIEAAIGYVKEANVKKVADYDVIVLGAPNHMGRPSRAIKKFVDTLSELSLRAKYVAVYGTYAGRIRAVDRAVKKLEKMVEKKLPNVNLISPSLSVRVNGVTGPIVEGELPKCVDFGKRIANQL